LAAERSRIWITGIGLVTSLGSDPDAFWSGLLEGRSGAAPVRSFDTADLPNHIGCEVKDFSVPDGIRPHVLGGRSCEFAAVVADQAVRSGGLDARYEGTRDLAVVVGTTMGDVVQFEQERARHPEPPADDADVATLASRPLDVMARTVANMYALRGPVMTVPAACAAGNYALGLAASLLARGEAKAALAIGCEAFSRLAFVGFSRMRAMSPDACRPFSRNRPGLLLGEGAAAILLETASSARERRAEPLAFLDGFGLSCDAFHITGPRQDGAGAAAAMEQALHRAGLVPEDIDYLNAHGTGTALNDRMESVAIHKVFGASARCVPVSSIKALTGHTLGAAGAIEAVASILALRRGVIPPTWNWLESDPDCDIDCVPNAPRQAELRHVLSNSYAFGGNNSSLVLSSPTV
jgi:3-oxoacyl-[acyl-carrier-protein] synthase II